MDPSVDVLDNINNNLINEVQATVNDSLAPSDDCDQNLLVELDDSNKNECENQRKKTWDMIYGCKYCNAKYTSSNGLNHHIKVHGSQSYLPCLLRNPPFNFE